MKVNLPCAIYTVIPLKNGRWSVKAAIPGTFVAKYHEFQSIAEVDAWIERHRQKLGLPAHIEQTVAPQPHQR
jgi:hypothetical protein